MKDLEPNQQLISTIAHDLRNPLGAIVAYADLLENATLPDKSQRHVEAIRRSARRINAMIQNLVDLSKLDSGQLTLAIDSLDVNDLIVDVEKAVQQAAARHRAKLETIISPAVSEVVADRSRLVQVLSVFVINGMQHGPAGGTVTLSIEPWDGNKAVRFSITDRGGGITPTAVEAYFGPREKSTARPARGLSLFMARRLIELHNGMAGVESDPATGTTFSFTIPAVHHQADFLPQNQRQYSEFQQAAPRS